MKNGLLIFGLTVLLSGAAFAQDGSVWFSDGLNGDDMMAFNQDLDEDFDVVIVDDGEAEMILPGGPNGQMPDELNLTTDQKDKIEKIRTSAHKTVIPLKADLELKQIELRELMRVDNPDKGKIAAKVKEMESVKTQIKLTRLNAHLDVQSVLTKEQREKMREMRSNRGHMRRFLRFHGQPGMMDDDMPRGEGKFKWKEKMN